MMSGFWMRRLRLMVVIVSEKVNGNNTVVLRGLLFGCEFHGAVVTDIFFKLLQPKAKRQITRSPTRR